MFQLVHTKTWTASITSGELAPVGGAVAVETSDDGTTVWSRNAHNSGFGWHHLRCAVVLTPRQGSDQIPMASFTSGFVARTFLPGSRDTGWRQFQTTELAVKKSHGAEHFDDFAGGTLATSTDYSSTLHDFGDFVLTVLGIALEFMRGTGRAALAQVKKGGKLGQVEETDTDGMGGSTALANARQYMLMFSGPENTLAFTAASEAAKAGMRLSFQYLRITLQ